MRNILKVTEYESGAGGCWYVTGTQQGAGWNWKYIPNMLQLDIKSYISLLKKYGANKIKYYAPTDCLLYSFDKAETAHKWTLFVNREAKKRNYYWGEDESNVDNGTGI